MWSRRNVLLWVLGFAAVSAAWAEPEGNGALRWRGGGAALGLQPAAVTPQLQCGPFSLACGSSTIVPLYASPVTPRSVSLQIGPGEEPATTLKVARTQGLSLAVVGKPGFFSELGVYGRVGTVGGRGSGLVALPGADGGLTYGVGLSWDFSRRASAVLGFDSYDFRGASGEMRDVRSTSLGLQWRY
ncbi:hypothetical protein GCM10028796_32880 [Ramlibacter monticola]|uniref:Outer membrane protein beta-barrel domain-containing protein n=1 Tax=Ramlibacter monticola TaxID=1926872 RepID=A0A937CV00_9BURK|nr:hypothetical protein [Ramlibacter monticola]MBL0394140.1 hypothetical protein [Ramlibacter monticola]